MRLWIAIVISGFFVSAVATGTSESTHLDREREHWSFASRAYPAVPAFSNARDKAWVQSSDVPYDMRSSVEAVNAFILRKLLDSGLRPAPLAKRRTLIRRLYFDLIGFRFSVGLHHNKCYC